MKNIVKDRGKIYFSAVFAEGKNKDYWLVGDGYKVCIKNVNEENNFLEIGFYIPKWWEFWKKIEVKISIIPNNPKNLLVDIGVN